MNARIGRRAPLGAFVIHRIRILGAATGRLPPAPKIASMWKSVFAAVLLAATLCACQENKNPPAAPLVSGGGNVKVLSYRFETTNEAAIGLSGGSITYIMARIELTNDTNQLLYPQINRIYLLDSQARHITANDTGSSVFIGVSNNLTGIRPGEKREFTVGFRGDASITGVVLYDYT